jgi:Zn-dependent protease
VKFTEREIKDLLISWVVLSLAFAILREGGIPGLVRGRFAFSPLLFFGRFIIVGTAFVLHELSHKYVAQKYNLWAEYQRWDQGLLFAFFLSLTGLFLFAAPGAVMIRATAWITPEIEAKTSIAGPISNIAVGIVALLIRSAGIFPSFFPGMTFFNFLTELAFINFLLALFNLFPIYPMDGSKVLRYNPMMWLVTIGTAAVLLFAAV